MKVTIDAKKKRILLVANSSEKKAFSLIAAYAGDSLIGIDDNIIEKLSSSFWVNTLVIDMKHPVVTKEFIQLLMRFQK